MRAGRRGAPVITPDVVREYAAKQGVCVRPVLRTVTDRQTGVATTVLIPCGSTRELKCPPCAEKARRLRMQQCAEGWHLEDDPLPPEPELDDVGDLYEESPDDGDEDIESDETSRRVRSTRRRADAAELPKVLQEHRSVGRTFTAPDGKVFRPSMFVTLTLGSYGKVIPGRKGKHVPGAGSPGIRPVMTTGGPAGRRCTSRGCSTGASRTCAGAQASRCRLGGRLASGGQE